jgi:hypothetical protein
MKKEKRVRTIRSKSWVNIQSRKQPGSASSMPPASQMFPMNFLKAVSVLGLMVAEEETRRSQRREDCTRLRIIQGATSTLIYQGTRLLCGVPHNGPEVSSGVIPFGPIEPTHEVEMARYHIADVWKRIQTEKADSAIGGTLAGLHDCIQHHPGLLAERAALSIISAGNNELIGLMNAEKEGRWNGRKLTGAEFWFAMKLHQAHRAPLAEFLALLNDVQGIFDMDLKRSKVAEVIGKILVGKFAILKMLVWLDKL